MFYEKLTKLCINHNISLTALLTDELHMSSGNLTKWKNGYVPKSDTVKRIADYFGVSVDSLLGNETKPADKMERPESELEKVVKQLTPENRERLTEYACFLKSRQDGEK